MRLVTGTISHETNVLSNISTDLEQFRRRRLLYGEEVFDYFKDTKTPVGGLMDGCESHGFELRPTIFASATPSGTITAEAFDTLLNARARRHQKGGGDRRRRPPPPRGRGQREPQRHRGARPLRGPEAHRGQAPGLHLRPPRQQHPADGGERRRPHRLRHLPSRGWLREGAGGRRRHGEAPRW